MEGLHVAHLILVSAWAGLVLAETVLELSARDASARAHAARIHYFIDLLAELPLLLGVLATGAVLSWRAWPLSTLHWIKVGCAMVALSLNLFCVVLVVVRHRGRIDEALVERYSGHVRLVGVGAPFAAVAAFIGLVYFT